MKQLINLLSYDKSIWLYPNGFCLVDSGNSLRQQFFRYADGDILSVKAMEFFQASSSDTSDVEVVIANEPPVVVPKELYHEEDAAKFVVLQYDAAKIAHTFAIELELYKLVYFLYQSEQNALERLSFAKHYTSYWDLLYKYAHQEQHPQNLVWAVEHEQYLDFLVEKKSKLTLLNRFDYVAAEDELYYIMNVKQQYQLGDAEVRILSENHRSPLKPLTKKYLDNYSWID
jgi:hypothetical protein